jgi:UDP-glucose-4-epimerase GalE
MSLLVTGGLGFVGSHFVRAATEQGREVVILDDGSGGVAPRPELFTRHGGRVHIVSGDIGDAALVTELCRRHSVTAVLHFAGKIQVGESVQKPGLYFDVNFCRALRMLDAVIAAGVRQLVFSSTAAVYGTPHLVPIPETLRGEPTSPYGRSKYAFEWALLSYEVAHGLRWAAPRYFNAAGAHPDGTLRESHQPETHLIPLCIDAALGLSPQLTVFGDDYETPDGTCIRDYIHVCDLARAHLLALAELEAGRSIGPMNLGTGEGYSVRQVLDTVSQVVGKAVPHTLGPRRAGDPPQLIANPTFARERLGFSTERSALPLLIEDALRSRR